MPMDNTLYKGNPGGLAKLRYDLSDYQILVQGSFVICAVSGKPIPLEELRYWNPQRQEAYSDAVASTSREIALKNAPANQASGDAATAIAPDSGE